MLMTALSSPGISREEERLALGEIVGAEFPALGGIREPGLEQRVLTRSSGTRPWTRRHRAVSRRVGATGGRAAPARRGTRRRLAARPPAMPLPADSAAYAHAA